jgi:uncharacterized short protein YbdD (DUF466 family)
MKQKLQYWWNWFRTLVGDNNYEQYCEHHQKCHANEQPLDRREFYMQYQKEKWSGIRRCC